MAEETHRIEVPVGRDRREVVAAQLWALGALGVWEQPGTTVAWFADRPPTPAGGDGLARELTDPGVSWSREADRDWQAAWKATISPIRAGRTVVVPTWLVADHQPAGDDELTLVLDPGRAFGTGHHATTSLCLELLDELDLAGELSGRSVADIGCGSGILAIAAAARGARVTAVDIDAEAVEVTIENARRNDVGLAAATGSVDAVAAPAEVVVANLISDVVIELATDLVAACRSVLMVSGITTERAEDVLASLTAAGAEVVEVRSRDGWIAARLATTAAGSAAGEPERAGVAPGEPHRAGVARTLVTGLLLLVVALLGAACTTPDVEDRANDEPDPADAAPALDPDTQALVDEIAEARALVASIVEVLETAADADDLTTVRAAAATADALLVADPADPDGDRGAAADALFPGELAERTEGPDTQDALTVLLTEARDIGGELGRALVEVLRDPIAGDLGAWELDAPGVVDNARTATAAANDVEAATERVLGLDGEGSRAIAWVTLAQATEDLDLARAAATRATDHLEVIDIALRSVVERTTGSPAADPSEETGDELGPGVDNRVDDGDGDAG